MIYNMHKSLILIFSLWLGLPAVAQTSLYKGDISMNIGDRAPKDKIIASFGQPYNIWASEDEAAGGYLEMYEYDLLRISVVDGLLWDFAVDDPDCVVVIHNRYRLKIGDSYLEFINSLPATDILRHILDARRVKLHFKMEGQSDFSDEALVIAYDKNGKISEISWAVPD